MDFCEDCGGLVAPTKDDGETVFECRSCGKEHEKEDGEMKITETKDETDRSHILEGDESESLPETDEECSECGNDRAHWWMEQTRAADEPETRFFRCTECGHTWREYD